MGLILKDITENDFYINNKKVKIECTFFMFKNQLNRDLNKIKQLEKHLQRAFNKAVNHSFVLEIKFKDESIPRLFRVIYNEKKKIVMISGGQSYEGMYRTN